MSQLILNFKTNGPKVKDFIRNDYFIKDTGNETYIPLGLSLEGGKSYFMVGDLFPGATSYGKSYIETAICFEMPVSSDILSFNYKNQSFLISSEKKKIIFDNSQSIKLDDELIIVFLKMDDGKIEPRGFGKIKIIEGQPHLWKPGQLVLSRYDTSYSGHNVEKGMAYRINDNYELVKIGKFDLSKSNDELLNDLRIIKIE